MMNRSRRQIGIVLLSIALFFGARSFNPAERVGQLKAVHTSAPSNASVVKEQLILEGAGSKDSGLTPEKPFLNYFPLKQKALLNEQELKKYHDSLSDSELVEACRDLLLAEGESAFSLERQELRMEMVEYLARGIEWSANPARIRMISVAQEMIERDLLALDLTSLQKRSLAGDQVELYQILMKGAPEVAEKIWRQSQGTSKQKLVSFARDQELKGMSL